jgi:hypothetical protein
LQGSAQTAGDESLERKGVEAMKNEECSMGNDRIFCLAAPNKNTPQFFIIHCSFYIEVRNAG